MACGDVNAILVGYRGLIAKLKAIYAPADKPEGDKPSGKPPKPGANFRRMAKWHNTKLEAKMKRGAK